MKTKAKKIIWKARGFSWKFRLIRDRADWYRLQAKDPDSDGGWNDLQDIVRDEVPPLYAISALEEALGALDAKDA